MLFPNLPTVTWKTPIPLAFTTAAPEHDDELWSGKYKQQLLHNLDPERVKHSLRETLNPVFSQSL